MRVLLFLLSFSFIAGCSQQEDVELIQSKNLDEKQSPVRKVLRMEMDWKTTINNKLIEIVSKHHYFTIPYLKIYNRKGELAYVAIGSHTYTPSLFNLPFDKAIDYQGIDNLAEELNVNGAKISKSNSGLTMFLYVDNNIMCPPCKSIEDKMMLELQKSNIDYQLVVLTFKNH